jgi:GNAT superfamily N-acetyltransferase
MVPSNPLAIRALSPTDYSQWLPLWRCYQEFYGTSIADGDTDITWARFVDRSEPMHAFGAFEGEALMGIVHIVFHRSTWTPGDYCYLQDLFTVPAYRGRGVGRALIEHVYQFAGDRRASRVYWLTHETNATAMALYEKLADRSGFIQFRKRLDG